MSKLKQSSAILFLLFVTGCNTSLSRASVLQKPSVIEDEYFIRQFI